MLPIGDSTTQALEFALQGLQARADVRADNVANVNTPGFRAKRVDFETSLRSALTRGGDVASARPTVSPAMSLPNPTTQNTVDLKDELVGMTRDNLMRDAMVNAFNFKLTALRTVIEGR